MRPKFHSTGAAAMESWKTPPAALMLLGILSSAAYAQATLSPSELPPPPPALSPSDLANPAASAKSPGSPTSPGAAIIKPSFKLLDNNHDGWISRNEAASIPDLARDFDRYDLNRDGKLDRGEFYRYAR